MVRYVWFIWSLIILGVWAVIYVFKEDFRKEMLSVSLATSLFGFTEPLFVPKYWFPPSLFNLAAKTGFDVESFIFSFSIGGIGMMLYRIVFPVSENSMTPKERHHSRHRLHRYILLLPIAAFLLLSVVSDINYIYIGIVSLFIGSLATLYCRPDLSNKIWVGGLLFMSLYFIYFGSILLFFPEYVRDYWNLKALTGIFILGIPIEELFFAFTFGMYWSGLYEHIYWYRLVKKEDSLSLKHKET